MRHPVLFILLSALLAALFVVDMTVGSTSVSLRAVWGALTGGECDPVERNIIPDY